MGGQSFVLHLSPPLCYTRLADVGGLTQLQHTDLVVLPGQDDDAATVIQEVFEASGMTVLNQSRAIGAVRRGQASLLSKRNLYPDGATRQLSVHLFLLL